MLSLYSHLPCELTATSLPNLHGHLISEAQTQGKHGMQKPSFWI